MIRKITLLAITSSWLIAGADIRGLVDYDQQDLQQAQSQEMLELVPLVEPVVAPVISAPIVIQQPMMAPIVPLPIVTPYPFYIGLDVVNARFSAQSGSDYNSLAGLVGKVGYDFNKYFGVEARFGTGINSEEISNDDGAGTTTTFEAELKETYGLYLKPQLPLNEYLNLFALVGYAQSKVDITNISTNAKGSADEGSISFGIGMGYHIDNRLDIVVDAVRLWHDVDFNVFDSSGGDTELTLDTFGIGLNYKF